MAKNSQQQQPLSDTLGNSGDDENLSNAHIDTLRVIRVAPLPRREIKLTRYVVDTQAIRIIKQ